VSLVAALAVLAVAVLAGGVAAVWREHGRRLMPGLGAFATVAAAAIALLHLLPEAIAEAGWGALVAALLALLLPVAVERLFPHKVESEDNATLLVGLAAVLVHQAGEGTAIASLARTGELGTSIVLAIAAHTVPLAMVVAMRALAAYDQDKHRRLSALVSLSLMAIATVMGALSLDLVGASRIASVRPWLVAAVAGFLLHALSHTPREAHPSTTKARVVDAFAGLVGLFVALFGISHEKWVHDVPFALRALGLVVLVSGALAKAFWPRKTPKTAEAPPLRSAGRDPRVG